MIIRRRTWNDKSGFTLIELSIVIFIMLMMLSATVPWMKNFAESTRLRSTARSIRSLMAFARSSAVSERTEYVVMFDPGQQEYWLSLLALLDRGSGNVVTDASRTSLTESLKALAEMDEDLADEDEDDERVEGSYSRTGGILGIPKKMPGSIDIVQISSPRTESGGSGGLEYITFYPDGTAEEFDVYLESQSGRIFLVSVTKSTGRAGIRELAEEEINELGFEAAD